MDDEEWDARHGDKFGFPPARWIVYGVAALATLVIVLIVLAVRSCGAK